MREFQEKAIVVNNLSRDFGDFKAVDDISFEVSRGEIFGFLGPNGAGKSTTIRMLNGLLLPTSGGGRVGGFDIIRENARIKEHIGYMSQRFSLYEDLTAEENLTFFGGVYGLPAERLEARITEVLNLVGLEDRRHDLTRTLPLGLKQRLALASAIIHEPSILFLDEATSGVDPISRRNFWDLIYAMAQEGRTILVTTQFALLVLELVSVNAVTLFCVENRSGASPRLPVPGSASNAYWPSACTRAAS